MGQGAMAMDLEPSGATKTRMRKTTHTSNLPIIQDMKLEYRRRRKSLWAKGHNLGSAPREATQDKEGQAASESAYPIWPGVPLPLLLPFISLGCFLTGLRAPWLMLKLSLQVLSLHGHKVYLCLKLHSLGSLHCFAQMLGARLRPGSPLRSWPLFALICAGCLRSRSIGSLHPSSSQLKPPLCALLWSPC